MILANCQIIEEFLKVYIDTSFRIVKKKIGTEMVFKFSRADYENASLENLIKAFTKLSNNKELIEELKGVKDIRNYCAHRAMYQEIHAFVNKETSTFDKVPIEKLHAIVSLAQNTLLEEFKKLFVFIQN